MMIAAVPIRQQEMHHSGIDTRQARESHRSQEAILAPLLMRIENLLRPHVETMYRAVGHNYRWNLTSLN